MWLPNGAPCHQMVGVFLEEGHSLVGVVASSIDYRLACKQGSGGLWLEQHYFTPHLFQVVGSFIFKNIWSTQKTTVGLVRWNIQMAVEKVGIWQEYLFRAHGYRVLVLQSLHISRPTIYENVRKMNIAMLRPFCREWDWSFCHLLQQYDSRRLQSFLHQCHALAPILNVHWVSINPEDMWVYQLHWVLSI